MKKWMLWVVALAALSGGASFSQAFAQNITGTWQGSLQAGGRELRVVFKVSTTDADKLAAVMYSIDQQSPAIPATTFTRNGSTVKMTIAALNGTYEGKLNADGNSITGTWTQGGPALPLNLTRATPETAWTIPEPPPPPVRMAADAKPGFEVATIKPSDPARPGKLFTVRGQDVITINTTLSDLITMAYDLHLRQVTGGPAWLESDKYDITGKPEVPGQPNVAQIKIMIQKLLADRFQLKFHREKKELSVYAITVGKTGAKLTASQSDPNSLPGLFFGRAAPSGMSFNVRNATIAEVAGVLQGSVLDKPVVDQTGLSEKYDFTLKFTPDPGQMAGLGGPPPPATDSLDAPPDIFAAFQQQLGLKLESTKAPADVMVIDKVEKPSAN
ncbi:MAG: TIGR03435 family protein [Acidobacteriia bacterium]|nr:TIGR03435 family protein [Terriglobia bacterium]